MFRLHKADSIDLCIRKCKKKIVHTYGYKIYGRDLGLV